MLSGGFLHAFRRQGFLYTFRGPDFQLSGDHATRLSGFFLTSRPAFRLSGFQEARLPPGVRGPGLSGCFQEVFRGFQEALK
jgi:hypothetical protein